MKVIKRGLAAAMAAAMSLTSVPFGSMSTVMAAGEVVSETKADVTVKLQPGVASEFNDTNDDGFGEFEGWGTSLCWWANRIGYSEKMTAQAAEMFFSDEGLDMNIGRYNVGGGDLVGEIAEVPVNENAQFYDLETEGRMPTYAGTSMSVSTNDNMLDVAYTASDADFGITKGKKVGSFKQIGWINKLDDAAGSGDNLHYTVNAAETGKYTVKLLLTLTGSNDRDVAIRVNAGTDAVKDYVADNDTVNSNMIASGNGNMLFLVTISDVELNEGDNTINIGGYKDWTLDFVKMAVIRNGKEGVLPEEEEFLHSPHITRSDSAIPGYAKDVTKIIIDEEHTMEWYEDEFARADEECGYAWNYDWDADKNQLNVLRAAAEASGEDFIAEAFSNSPPYFMTNSGCSSGAVDSSKDNLRADSYNAFAAYMADVIEHWWKEGIKFQSTTPMNEPYTNYWGANSNKQEGCHFDQGDSQSKIIVALNKELENKGIDIVISGTDETSIDTQITSYNKLSEEAKAVVGRIDTHTYSGSNRSGLNSLAESEGKNLWMSEVDGAYTAGTNAGEMSAALGFAKQIITDVNGLEASAWIMWNAVDMHVDKNNDADPDSMEALLGEGTNDVTYNPEGGYWGIAIGDHNNQEIVPTMKYYAYGQFSRYIRPGYTIIASGSNTLAAYDPEAQKVVVVAINTSDADKTWKFNLSDFSAMGNTITAIRTSGTRAEGEKWADVTDSDNIVADTTGRSFTATMKANSITTYIVEGVTYDGSSSLTEIPVDDSMVTGSVPWNNDSNHDVYKVVDGDLSTYFDGVSNGWIQIDLGKMNRIDAISYAPRSGEYYEERCIGASVYGSADGETWTLLHTIVEKPEGGVYTWVYAEDFETDSTVYRYIRYAVPEGDTSANCNLAEIKLYGKEVKSYSEEEIAKNDYMLYLVNCGTPDSSVVPDGYTMGLYQSNVDQQYSADPDTDIFWGYAANDEYSNLVPGGSSAESLDGCFYYMSDKITFMPNVTGMKYNFEMPFRANNNYVVTIGMKVPGGWGSRKVDITLEGETVDTQLALEKGVLVEKEYQVTVTDGELNVMVHNPQAENRGEDPVLSYIIVKAVPSYTVDSLQAVIEAQAEKMEGKTYSEKSMAAYKEALEAAQNLVEAGSADTEELEAAQKALVKAFEGLKETITYTSITGTDGARLIDNNGEKIQAHGGQIQQFTINGETKYYWYGEDKTNGYRPVTGVHLYTSTDLYNWTDEGVVLKTIPVSEEDYGKDQEEGYQADLSVFETNEYFKELYGDYAGKEADDAQYSSKLEEVYWNLAEDRTVIERPKVLYNDKTGQYVMWFHADGRTPGSSADYGKARAGVAVSDSPDGPFRLVGTYLLASGTDDHSWDDVGGHVRDMNLFKDDDGTGYVLYSSEGNTTMYIARLNDSYTGLAVDPSEAEPGKDFNIISTDSREAPALFKYDGTYYLITSGCTGWNPNQARYTVTDDLMGTWTVMGDPCVGDTKGTTFDTQSTCVFPVDAEKGKFIYMGDRWFNPDNGGDLSDSRYVWIPVEFGTGNTLSLKSYSNWTLDELENKGKIEILTELPENAVSVAKLKEALPATVDVTAGGIVYTNTPVTWSIAEEKEALGSNVLGTLKVAGTLTDLGRDFTIEVFMYNKNLRYFADCYTGDDGIHSDMHDELSRYVTLKNSVSDQKYTGDNGWGYTGTTQAENKDSYDIGSKGSDDFYSCGWWAGSGKNIEYAFELNPGAYTIATGYQEWWNTTRYMKVTVISVDAEGGTAEIGSTAFTLDKKDQELEILTDITVPEDSEKVLISVSKTSGSDPVLSWIGIMDRVDKTALKEAIENAPGAEEERKYTAASWKKYQAVYKEACKVLESENAAQNMVDRAVKNLLKAQDNLVTLEEKLAEGIKKYTVDEKYQDIYTEKSWNAYMKALTEARKLQGKEGLTEKEVDKAICNLRNAKNQLKKCKTHK